VQKESTNVFFLTGKLNKVLAFRGQTFILSFTRGLNKQIRLCPTGSS